MDLVISGCPEHIASQSLSVSQNGPKLAFKSLSVHMIFLTHLLQHKVANRIVKLAISSFTRARLRELTLLAHLSIRALQQINRQIFDALTCHAIFTVNKLDQMVTRCSHSTVILDHDIFESFDQSSRNVTSLGSLDSSVNQTFSTTHSVEVKLRWSKSTQIAALDEAFRLGSKVILGEVRQGSLVESEWDSLTFDILLAYTSHDLRNVDVATLGACTDHISEPVGQAQSIESDVARLVTSIIELLVDLSLETLLHRLSWLRLELAKL